MGKIAIRTTGALVIWSLVTIGYHFRGNRTVPPYVEANLGKIIEPQEKFLGIGHFGKPKIKYSWGPGSYDPLDDTIYIGTGFYSSPGKNLENTLAKLFNPLGHLFNNFPKAEVVDDVIRHETAHRDTYRIARELGIQLPNRLPLGLLGVNMEFKVIIEGIGAYFEKGYSENIEWPNEENDYHGVAIYSIGFKLVKPIIDRFGKKGIEHLLKNPPNRNDLIKLQDYQQRAISALSNN